MIKDSKAISILYNGLPKPSSCEIVALNSRANRPRPVVFDRVALVRYPYFDYQDLIAFPGDGHGIDTPERIDIFAAQREGFAWSRLPLCSDLSEQKWLL
jgi:hypothetical protein